MGLGHRSGCVQQPSDVSSALLNHALFVNEEILPSMADNELIVMEIGVQTIRSATKQHHDSMHPFPHLLLLPTAASHGVQL